MLGPIAQEHITLQVHRKTGGPNPNHADSAPRGTASQQCQLWCVLDQPVGRGLMDLFHQRHRLRWEQLDVKQLANYPPCYQIECNIAPPDWMHPFPSLHQPMSYCRHSGHANTHACATHDGPSTHLASQRNSANICALCGRDVQQYGTTSQVGKGLVLFPLKLTRTLPNLKSMQGRATYSFRRIACVRGP